MVEFHNFGSRTGKSRAYAYILISIIISFAACGQRRSVTAKQELLEFVSRGDRIAAVEYKTRRISKSHGNHGNDITGQYWQKGEYRRFDLTEGGAHTLMIRRSTTTFVGVGLSGSGIPQKFEPLSPEIPVDQGPFQTIEQALLISLPATNEVQRMGHRIVNWKVCILYQAHMSLGESNVVEKIWVSVRTGLALRYERIIQQEGREFGRDIFKIHDVSLKDIPDSVFEVPNPSSN